VGRRSGKGMGKIEWDSIGEKYAKGSKKCDAGGAEEREITKNNVILEKKR